MFLRHGVIDEARAVGGKYGWDSEAMSANVYRYAREYIDGRISLESAIEHSKIADWHLAKRQLTWFNRRTFIRWLELDEAHTTLTQVLAHLNNS
jgi:tRNA dimethylallyltransferase